MATFLITHVRKELAPNGTHHHIAAVCTDSGEIYTVQEVVDSMEEGNVWRARSATDGPIVSKLRFCPRPTCLVSPYIRVAPAASLLEDLEDLPEC